MKLHEVVNRLFKVYGANRVELILIDVDSVDFRVVGFGTFSCWFQHDGWHVAQLIGGFQVLGRNSELIRCRILDYVRDDAGNLRPRNAG